MQHLYLVTVPNSGGSSSEATIQGISSRVSQAHLHRFVVPSLVVGTLDALMSLSDDLTKFNTQIENVVRKVERQYLDIAGSSPAPLKVNEGSVETFLRRFSWDAARFQVQGRPLGDLVSQIQGIAGKIDDELKKLTNTLQEKQTHLAALQRRKTVNLATSEFEDFLTPEQAARLDICSDPESILQTIFVVTSKNFADEFMRVYETVGKGIVAYKDEMGREVKGSPIVPNSAKLILEEGDAVLFSLVIIKNHFTAGHYEGETFIPGTTVSFLEPLKAAFREMRCTLREFKYEENRPGGLDGQITEAKGQADNTLQVTVRWCQAHFGEIYSAWIHLKVIKAFVESVLRYGLPVNFTSFFVEPDVAGRDKQILASLTSGIVKLCPELGARSVMDRNEEGEEESEEAAVDNLPYVCQRFNVIGAGAAGAGAASSSAH